MPFSKIQKKSDFSFETIYIRIHTYLFFKVWYVYVCVLCKTFIPSANNTNNKKKSNNNTGHMLYLLIIGRFRKYLIGEWYAYILSNQVEYSFRTHTGLSEKKK